MSQRPTIKTIAQIAGVTHATVSKALRDHDDISKEMKEKIKKIAKEIGYTPNAWARNLSMRHSQTIGMIVPAMGNDTVYSDVFEVISGRAAKEGLSVILGSCNRDPWLEEEFCRKMVENRVAALIVAPISTQVEHIKRICSNTVPILFTGGKIEPTEENYLIMDYQRSAEIAVKHLYELGHRDIALFLYHPENRTIQQKREGYQKMMRKMGLAERVYMEGDSGDTFSAGRTLVYGLYQSHRMPTAIWCASDLMALGAMDALKEKGYRVGKDVSVMGHDNLFFSGIQSVSLTTITMPKEEMGQKIVSMCLKLMKEESMVREVISGTLVKRNSTGKRES